MTIFVLGLNHKTASIDLRERVFFTLEKLSLYLTDLLNRDIAREAVLLSTCNRSELYCEADDLEEIKNWFCSQHGLNREEIAPFLYSYQNETAVAHMMSVACGLDSMVLGEPQIFGQMKQAFSESCSVGGVSALFHRLFQEIFTVAKEIRATTAIGACPVSVASSVMYFAKRQIPNFKQARILVVGAGETAELLLRYLQKEQIQPAGVVNRSIEKAEQLTKEYGGQAFLLDDLAQALAVSDIVLTATGSATPIITRELITQCALPRTLWLFDLAVPRDIEPDVASIAHLYCIDDLKTIIEEHKRGREHAADKALEMIQQKSQQFMQWLASSDAVSDTIKAFRGQIEALCKDELLKAKKQLLQGVLPAQVLDNFARAVTNKLVHTPSVELRQAGVEGRIELLHLTKRLFALPDPEAKVS